MSCEVLTKAFSSESVPLPAQPVEATRLFNQVTSQPIGHPWQHRADEANSWGYPRKLPDGTVIWTATREQCYFSPIAKAMGRSVLASGELGRHNGLPATIIVTTTLQDLHSAAGLAVTAGARCYRCVM